MQNVKKLLTRFVKNCQKGTSSNLKEPKKCKKFSSKFWSCTNYMSNDKVKLMKTR